MFLGVETSSSGGGLAIGDNSKVIAVSEWARAPQNKRQSHSEVITTELQSLLKNTNLELTDLKGLVLTIGPGSFTGIRVGLNLVKTLSYSLQLPIFAFNSLETLAADSPDEGPVLCLLNAFRNMVYVGTFEVSPGTVKPLGSPQALTTDELEAFVSQPMQVIGDGYPMYRDALPPALNQKLKWVESSPLLPRVNGLMKLFYSRQKSASPLNWKNISPLYLRPSSAEENREKGLLKPLAKLND